MQAHVVQCRDGDEEQADDVHDERVSMKGSVVGVFENKIRVLDGTDVELQRRCSKFEREVVVVARQVASNAFG